VPKSMKSMNNSINHKQITLYQNKSEDLHKLVV
jgi:hypothetical protein